MKIEYLGHACFKLISGENSLVIDPYQDGSVPGISPLRTEAAKVVTSHEHADHHGIECVNIVDGDEMVFKIETLACWHDDQHGQLRGPNTIHVISCEGFKIAHLGDLGHDLDETLKAGLRNIDVLMIPVGGHFTIDADLAAKIAKTIAPKCIIPMHYKGENFGYDVLGTVVLFTKHFTGVRETGNVIEVGENMPEVAVMSFNR